MASLTLSDSAFGTLGLTITEAIDLADIAQQLSSLLGMTFSFESLDVSSVTLTGLTATGIGAPGSRLAVGDYDVFQPASAVSGFTNLQLTNATIDSHGSVYEVADGGRLIGENDSLGFEFGAGINVLDFSRTGSAELNVALNTVAPFDDPGTLYGGYEFIGNSGDNVFTGYDTFDQGVLYFGSNVFRAGDGEDAVFGGLGQELIEGGADDDLLFGMLYVSSGFSQNDPGDLIFGDFEEPEPGAEGGDDLLFGGLGDDRLDGGAGNDLVFASEGADSLTGGAGRDRFVLAEDYNIRTGIMVPDGEGGEFERTVYTGTGVADADSPNRVEDFSADDLVVIYGSSNMITDPGTLFDILFDTNTDNQAVVNLVGDAESQFSFDYTLVDITAGITERDVIIAIDQAQSGDDDMNLNFRWSSLVESREGEISFEVVYDAPGDSVNFNDGLLYDRFFDLQLTPFQDNGGPGGQDKFDLTALELGDDNPSAIEDILFTTLDEYGNFTIESFGDPEDPAIDDFFFDAEAGVDRAVSVEWRPSGFADDVIAVYVDANADGNFHPGDDLFFTINGVEDGNGVAYDSLRELTKEDLYADPDADGSGTGIFIFNDDQYDLWFNDIAPDQIP
ncbi:calcium-binding protein [Parahaliea mediterranea]|uniref:calcium-binding protein n=1 Tax=Parahaliea mediterranea TaxID=651086 RepID=UPI000E2EB013|nr:calcium-binding protein [Parahaliea mediterranea]